MWSTVGWSQSPGRSHTEPRLSVRHRAASSSGSAALPRRAGVVTPDERRPRSVRDAGGPFFTRSPRTLIRFTRFARYGTLNGAMTTGGPRVSTDSGIEDDVREDAELIAAVRGGDVEATGELY